MLFRPIAVPLFLVAVLTIGGAAHADSYLGKIDLISVKDSGQQRFFVHADSLSLFAEGGYADVLRECFFRQVRVSVGYDVIRCPGGITGTCGRVTFLTLHKDALISASVPDLPRLPGRGEP